MRVYISLGEACKAAKANQYVCMYVKFFKCHTAKKSEV